MQFVNLCPHVIKIHRANGEVVEVPASGSQARVTTTSVVTREVLGVPVQVVEPGAVTGLPDPDGASLFIVSAMVRQALKEQGCRRPDIFAPATAPTDGVVRDAAGQVAGVTRLNGLV